MAIKLIALDCDGTLLDDKGKVLNSSVKAIERAKRKGCKIVLVTGRPYISTKPILEKLGLDNRKDEYVALFHGAVLQDTAGNVVSTTPLALKDFIDLDLFAINQGINMVAEAPDCIYTTTGNLDLFVSFESYKNKLPIKVRTLTQFLGMEDIMHVYKILLVGKKEKLDKIQRNISGWMKDRFTIARSEDYCIDISAKQISKGWALKQLADKLNIKPTEIMAFGNADNDISMIKYAKFGIAMSNSSQNLLKEANEKTSSNNEDGIAKSIDMHI